eukprot:COSAG05_NODE_2084_length_3598_cov_1.349528_1_plen_29_part_10
MPRAQLEDKGVAMLEDAASSGAADSSGAG